MGVNMDYLNEDSTHAAQGADAYPAVPDSNPWGVGGVPDEAVSAYGTVDSALNGFYHERDMLVGGTETEWNMQAETQQSGARWASYGDTAPVFNASSGLGSGGSPDGQVWTPVTAFSETRSQDSLAGGENPATPYGH